MLQAHSFLWHYLWVAPNLLLLILACLMWRRHLHKKYPLFFAFAVASAVEQLLLYAADMAPSIDAATWWRVFWAGLLIEGVLKFALIGEIFAHAFSIYASVARLSRVLIRTVGVVLVLTAAVAAAYAPHDSRFGIVSGAHLLQQTIFLTESGLLLFVFVFSACLHVRFARPTFGIALGLAASACVHMATWGVVANGGLAESNRILLDFVNMVTFHMCVLIWFYYLLTPDRTPGPHLAPANSPAAAAAGGDLEGWNRELERLVHR